MPRVVKCGLIQAIHACATTEKLETIREANVAKHMKLIEQAGREGVQILCMQEIFTGPYFCAEQSARWYDSVEAIPDGPTTKLMQEVARRHSMVIIVPLYEEDGRASITTPPQSSMPTAPTWANIGRTTSHTVRRGSGKSSTSGRATWISSLQDAVCRCRGLHLLRPPFSGGRARAGPQWCRDRLQPSATVAGLSEYLWRLEQPAHAVANAFFVGAINRVGYEDPWRIGEFYGQSYFCNPRGQLVAEAARDRDELVTAELDLDQIREVRNVWQFYRDRGPRRTWD